MLQEHKGQVLVDVFLRGIIRQSSLLFSIFWKHQEQRQAEAAEHLALKLDVFSACKCYSLC